jgi:hypothetical protein
MKNILWIYFAVFSTLLTINSALAQQSALTPDQVLIIGNASLKDSRDLATSEISLLGIYSFSICLPARKSAPINMKRQSQPRFAAFFVNKSSKTKFVSL